jgi:TolA-binding protein
VLPLVLLILSQFACEVRILSSESTIELKPSLSYPVSALVSDLSEYPEDSTIREYYDSLIYSGVPTRKIIDVEERLAYEAAMIEVVVELNRQRYRVSHDSVIERLKVYFERFPDSVNAECGGELRAFLLYNQGEAKYYTSYVRGRIRYSGKREESREIYQRVLETYPNSIAAEFAQVTLIWYKLEEGKGYWGEVIDEFGNIVETSRTPEARMLAAYGTGLAYFYKGDYEKSALWFFDEKGYESIGIVTLSELTEDSLHYNEGINDIITLSLFKRASCLERLENPYAAFGLYQHIARRYPKSDRAGDASSKIVEYYINTSQIDEADKAVRRIQYKMTENPRVYRRAYGYSLALLYQYYESVDDTINSVKYVKKLQSELGNTEYIEQLYYEQAMCDTSVVNIGHLRGTIEKIRARMPSSSYLPDPLFLLSLLLIEGENFSEAKDILMELKNWPDATATRDRMPEISYQLARIYFTLENYEESANELEWWLENFKFTPPQDGMYFDDFRSVHTPYIYYWLGRSYLNLGDYASTSGMKRNHYAKALVNFGIIKGQYEDSDLYYDNSEKIIQYIEECDKKIAGVE